MRLHKGDTTSPGPSTGPCAFWTPLVPSVTLQSVYFKLETCNPTGSYKDRFTAAEVERMMRLGIASCFATSSGNTGSSLAAYCARHGIRCTIVVPDSTPAGKIAQMQAHGARTLLLRDFVTNPEITSRTLEMLAARGHLVASAYRYCPDGMAGVESMAHEIGAQYPDVKHIFVPVGGGGLFTAICRGIGTGPWRGGSPPAEQRPVPRGKTRPSGGVVEGVRVHAIQPEGCSTVAAAFERGDDRIVPVTSTTRISGLAVPFDIDASLALQELRRVGGFALTVSDDEVWRAQREMLVKEGIYCEPAGAAALAGLHRACARGLIRNGEPAVCLVTGHGFKDPDSIQAAGRQHPARTCSIEELAELVE